MPALNFREIAAAQSGPDRDQFELFAREFLAAMDFKVLEGPDRGPDGGRDLIVEEVRSGPGGQTRVRWLVSCKHQAHSGRAVSTQDEQNIRDRMERHQCKGFIGFYSTIPSSSLSAFFYKARFEILIFDPEKIEAEIIKHQHTWGRTLWARFMGGSFDAWYKKGLLEETAKSTDPQLIKNNFFLRKPHTDLKAGLAEAAEKRLPAFIVIFDEHHPTKSKLDYSLGYFMEYQTTKRLVDQHFVAILGASSDPQFSQYVPEDDPLENCLWVVIDLNGNVVRREGVYGNPDEGLKRVRAVIAS